MSHSIASLGLEFMVGGMANGPHACSLPAPSNGDVPGPASGHCLPPELRFFVLIAPTLSLPVSARVATITANDRHFG